MERIIRNVRDLERHERQVYEAALGEKLREDQQVILQVINLDESRQQAAPPSGTTTEGLPDWCDVYKGLSDDEIAEIESTILDRNGWTRES